MPTTDTGIQFSKDTMVLAQTIVKKQIDVSSWAKSVELAAQRAVYKLGRETRDMARAACPVDTGALRASIYVTRAASVPNQVLGDFAKGQASAGYFRAAKLATRLNKKLSMITDEENSTDPRTQRSLVLPGEIGHTSSYRITAIHGQKAYETQPNILASMSIGTRALTRFMSVTRYKRTLGANELGRQIYQVFEEDDRTILPMGETTQGTFFVTIGAAAYYAGYVEYGTHTQRAQPFMTPAVNWARTQLEGRLASAIGAEKASVVVSGNR